MSMIITEATRNVLLPDQALRFHESAQLGWDAALLELEHQADHWDTPDHGQVGHLIAEALRAAVSARNGGLRCEHRDAAEAAPDASLQLIARTRTLALLGSAGPEQPSSVAWTSPTQPAGSTTQEQGSHAVQTR